MSPLRYGFVVALFGVVLSACGDSEEGGEDSTIPQSTQPEEEEQPSEENVVSTTSTVERSSEETAQAAEPDDPVELVLTGLSTEQRIGQLISTFVYGSDAFDVTDEQSAANTALYGVSRPAEVVERYYLGGVLLLGRNPFDPEYRDLPTNNYQSPEQLAEFTNDLQRAAADSSGVGLLISADQEGGRVNRLRAGMTVFPAPASYGSIDDLDFVEESAYVSGVELMAVGVNHVLGPVADVVADATASDIGDRSFGSDPERVAEMVEAALEGYRRAGIAAAVKHFPGHGATDLDSHESLPVVQLERAAWEGTHRLPFVAAIEAGVPSIMTAHLAWPALDPSGDPATVSRSLNQQELRSVLGFQGVIVTDSLWMGGLTESVSEDEAVVRAIEAGANLLLSPPDVAGAIKAIEAALDSGRLSGDQLEEAVRRVLTLKHEKGILEPHLVDDDKVLELVATDEHAELRRQVKRICEALEDPKLDC